jgi:hypothetical protein
MKTLWLRAALQLALILGIAAVSGYHLPDFRDSNWQTVLFLTPWGLVANNLEPNSAIATFYGDKSPGQLGLGPSQAALLGVLWAMGLVNFVLFIFALKTVPARKGGA